eukprot:Platyproteum_vivax@DN5165_c0_g1_i1.p1
MFSGNDGGYGGYGGGYGGYDSLAGGGYDSSQTTGGGAYGTPAADKPASRKRGLPGKAVDGVMPCMIGQLLTANEARASPDDSLMINGRECNQVTVVGRIEAKDMQNMSVSLTLSDRSGELVVKKYYDGDDSKYSAEVFNLGSYVRVVGILRHQGFLGAFGVNPVLSPNEVLYHESECAYVHCCLLEQDGASNLDFSAAPTAKPTYTTTNYPSQTGGAKSAPSLKDDSTAVEGLLLKEPQPLGYTPQELSSRLGWNISRVQTAIESLAADGQVYETAGGKYDHVESSG